MTTQEWELLMFDFGQMKDASLVILMSKNDYLFRLPNILQGLAAVDESKARTIGIRAEDQWQKDRRREAHDALTWELMRPDSHFHVALLLFNSGVPRRECGRPFRIQLSFFRFGSSVETTIEEKHLRTTLARKPHHIGPVRLSLANRLPSRSF